MSNSSPSPRTRLRLLLLLFILLSSPDFHSRRVSSSLAQAAPTEQDATVSHLLARGMDGVGSASELEKRSWNFGSFFSSNWHTNDEGGDENDVDNLVDGETGNKATSLKEDVTQTGDSGDSGDGSKGDSGSSSGGDSKGALASWRKGHGTLVPFFHLTGTRTTRGEMRTTWTT
ncbi:hypothetical protein BT69DRAFT_879216 [Atractiella rhizophila]|nr:hypothetical protein BT69DRAFT_879216 [Atractiella rhizophila]